MCYSVFKTVFLFIGAVIGAGFATGSEIMLYFQNSSLFSVVLAGIFLGLFAYVYGIFGRLVEKFYYIEKILDIIVFLSSFITIIAMISGAEEIIFTAFNFKFFGVITGVFVAFLMFYDMRIIKIFNSVLVPLILVILVVLLSINFTYNGGTFTLKNSIMYSSMNMMLGGYIMTKEGKKFSNKQMVIVSLLITLFLTFMMICAYLVASVCKGGNMPIYSVACKSNLGYLAGVLIYLAIFTTLISAERLVGDILIALKIPKFQIVLFFTLICLISYKSSFKSIVNTSYILVGYLGIIYNLFLFFIILYCIIMHIKRTKNNKSLMF